MILIKQIYSIKNNKKTLIRQISTFFDTNGKERERHIYTGSDRPGLKILSQYNQSGQLIRTTTKDGNNHLKSEVILRYDSAGRLVEKAFADAGGHILSKQVWQFNAHGKLARYAKLNHDEKPIFERRYEYDKNGQLKEERHFDENEQLTVLKIKKYDYDGLEINERIFDANHQLIAKKYILYDKGNVPAEISWYDAKDVIRRLESFSYSPEEVLIHEIILDFYVNQAFFKEYDNQGKLRKQLHKIGGRPVSEEIYEYDTAGQLQRRLKYAFQDDKKSAVEEIIYKREF